MPDPTGFLKHGRQGPPRRPVDVRIQDWREVYSDLDARELRDQAARCMDCGIPFCHSDTAGCPLGNLIPEWNDLVRTGQWRAASERLHATNNFGEFTGRLCPAPCESACVLGLVDDPVTIEQVEKMIVDRAWSEGWIVPRPSVRRTGRRVAVVGSGPAGLAAAQQLTRAGHAVTVYERDDRPGGLLRYGIPEFKMEKHHLDRRLEQMAAEGTVFVTGADVGRDLPVDALRSGCDAVVLAVGATVARDVEVPGRSLRGVHLAMEHLVPANRVAAGTSASSAPEGFVTDRTVPGAATGGAAAETLVGAGTAGTATGLVAAGVVGGTPVDAAGKHVVIIGGGDTAADCLGTAHRQGAASVTQLDLYPEPPAARDEGRDPWPTWPVVLRSYAAHEEGGSRMFAVAVERFVDDGQGRVAAVDLREVSVRRDAAGQRVVTPVSAVPRRLPCDLALLAIGFAGVERSPLLAGLGVEPDAAGRIPTGPDWQTAAPGVFACGDATRGASLVVWAIAEGRSVAAAVDAHLSGETTLPAPVHPGARPLAPTA